MSDLPHTAWTVSSTAYLRNLDPDDLRGECIAVHYQKPPMRNEEAGTTSYSLRFPLLIFAAYVEKPNEVAERVAAILNKHWDSCDD